MSEENISNEVVENEASEGNANEASEPTNAEYKSTPAYRSMAKQIADFKQREAERTATEEREKRESEQKKLIEQGRFEESLKLKNQEIETVKKQHERDLQERDLRFELASAGVDNDTFMRGAMLGYSPEDGTIQEYVASLAATQDNEIFFTGKQQPKPKPPGTPGASGGGPTITKDNYREMLKSDDSDVRSAARNFVSANHDTLYR